MLIRQRSRGSAVSSLLVYLKSQWSHMTKNTHEHLLNPAGVEELGFRSVISALGDRIWAATNWCHMVFNGH